MGRCYCFVTASSSYGVIPCFIVHGRLFICFASSGHLLPAFLFPSSAYFHKSISTYVPAGLSVLFSSHYNNFLISHTKTTSIKMRFITTSALLFLTSSLTVSALPVSSGLAVRQDDLTISARALDSFELAEEAEEEAADIKFLLARDQSLQDAIDAAAAAAEDTEYSKRSALKDFEQLEADEEAEEAEEAEDIKFLAARDAALSKEMQDEIDAASAAAEETEFSKRAKLQDFEAQEAAEDAEDEE